MKKPILSYCIIAYTITWAMAFGIYHGFKNGELTEYQVSLYHSFAALGPTIGALISTYYFYGSNGLKRLFDKFRFNFPNRKFILIVLSPFLFFVLGVLIYPLFRGEWYNFGLFRDNNWASPKSILVWILPLLTYAIFEEIGWRGFLLPHLQERYNAWTATIYLTIIWAFWHLPFFFYRFDFSVFISIGFFFGIFVGAIILTSLYNSSRGFLISAIMFHFLNNLSSMFDKEFIAAILSAGFVFVAVYIYRKYGRLNLSGTERTGNYLTA